MRRCLTLDATATSADLVDFPALILLEADPALAAHARKDGGDLSFTLTDGTRLSHELEAFDSATGALTAWVRIPVLSSAVNTSLHLYFGNPAAADQQDAANVWDPGHVAVWHLSQDPSGQPPQVRDSTRNALAGEALGAMTASQQVAGRIGGALRLDGVDDFINLGNPPLLRLTQALTVEAWFQADAIRNDELISKMGHDGERSWDISFDDDPDPALRWVMFRTSQTGKDPVSYTGYEIVTTGRWYHVAAVLEPGGFRRLYLDGLLVAEEMAQVETALHDSAVELNLGRKPTGTGYFAGWLDEVRLSSVARSSAWIQATFKNQSSPGALFQVGPVEPWSPGSDGGPGLPGEANHLRVGHGCAAAGDAGALGALWGLVGLLLRASTLSRLRRA